MEKDKIILSAILVVGIIIFSMAVYSTIATPYSQEAYKKALNSELSNKCATPAGYTDEQWRQHMGHHPDRYAECL